MRLRSLPLQCALIIASSTCRRLFVLAAVYACSRLQHSFPLMHAACPGCLLHAISVPSRPPRAAHAAVPPCLQKRSGDSAAPSSRPESSYFGDKADGMEDLPPLPKDTGVAGTMAALMSPTVALHAKTGG